MDGPSNSSHAKHLKSFEVTRMSGIKALNQQLSELESSKEKIRLNEKSQMSFDQYYEPDPPINNLRKIYKNLPVKKKIQKVSQSLNFSKVIDHKSAKINRMLTVDNSFIKEETYSNTKSKESNVLLYDSQLLNNINTPSDNEKLRDVPIIA